MKRLYRGFKTECPTGVLRQVENIERVQYCPDVAILIFFFFAFFSFCHSHQMSEGSRVSKVTLCVEILKWH